jgi:hypothetical protein
MFSAENKAEADSRLVIKPNRASEIISVVGVIFLGLVVTVGITGGEFHYTPATGFVVAVEWAIIALYAIYRVVKALLRPKIYVFDRASDTFSLDGESLGSLSEIKKVMINRKKVTWGFRYAVDIVHESMMDRVGLYYSKDSATKIAARISSFLRMPQPEQ